MNPLDVHCYRCGSPVGEPCRTIQDREPNRSGVYGYRGAGEVAEHFHRVRQVAASTGGVRTADSYLVAEIERLTARETALTAENKLLRAELDDEWDYNHAEHCGCHEWNDETLLSVSGYTTGTGEPALCHWPKPPVLFGDLTRPDFQKPVYLRREAVRGVLNDN